MTHIVLVGPMGSGKTTLANILVKDYGYQHWASTTTRPPRYGEVDGVDYLFVNDEEFTASAGYGYLVAIREYETAQGLWRYGFPIEPIPEGDTVSILDPSGLMEVCDRIPDIFPVYLDVPEPVRYYRTLVRGDELSEIERRFESDRKDFAEFQPHFQEYCKIRLAKDRTPEANAQRIIEGVQAYKTGALKG